jgi:hypothetical protein
MNKLPISSAEDALKFGQMIARSGTFGVNSDEGGAVIALMCHQEDISLLEFQRTYHWVDNKPAMKADTMAAKFLNMGWNYEVIERSETVAKVKTWKDDDSKAKEYSLTIEEVKIAGYCFAKGGKTLKDNWRVRPKNMLWARLMSDTIRLLEPRVNAGTYTDEEIADFSENEEQTPGEEPKPLKQLPPEAAPKAVDPEPIKDEKPTTKDPFSTLPDDGTDYTICPVGKHKGKKWMDLGREILDKVAADPRGLSPKYVDAVKDAIERTPF